MCPVHTKLFGDHELAVFAAIASHDPDVCANVAIEMIRSADWVPLKNFFGVISKVNISKICEFVLNAPPVTTQAFNVLAGMGIDVVSVEIDGVSILAEAVKRGNVRALQALFECGASPNAVVCGVSLASYAAVKQSPCLRAIVDASEVSLEAVESAKSIIDAQIAACAEHCASETESDRLVKLVELSSYLQEIMLLKTK